MSDFVEILEDLPYVKEIMEDLRMSCNCVHNRENIIRDFDTIMCFREYFIKRMTVDSETTDRRRKDFNQAIFYYNDDGTTDAVWSETDLEMVMQCFDDALEDFKKRYCDVPNCKRKII